jgi:hypothetical protein
MLVRACVNADDYPFAVAATGDVDTHGSCRTGFGATEGERLGNAARGASPAWFDRLIPEEHLLVSAAPRCAARASMMSPMQVRSPRRPGRSIHCHRARDDRGGNDEGKESYEPDEPVRTVRMSGLRHVRSPPRRGFSGRGFPAMDARRADSPSDGKSGHDTAHFPRMRMPNRTAHRARKRTANPPAAGELRRETMLRPRGEDDPARPGGRAPR